MVRLYRLSGTDGYANAADGQLRGSTAAPHHGPAGRRECSDHCCHCKHLLGGCVSHHNGRHERPYLKTCQRRSPAADPGTTAPSSGMRRAGRSVCRRSPRDVAPAALLDVKKREEPWPHPTAGTAMALPCSAMFAVSETVKKQVICAAYVGRYVRHAVSSQSHIGRAPDLLT